MDGFTVCVRTRSAMSPDSAIRILHLANNLSNHGNGIINVAVDLAVEQARRGNTVAFASGGGGYETLLQGAGVQCLSAKQTGAASAVQNSFGLLGILRQFKPHLVHVHMRNGLALVLPWTRLLRIPVIMHLHN